MKTIKQNLVFALILLFSLSVFSQKDEMKAAGKAINKNNFPEALANLKKVEGMLGSLDDKTKAKFYYYKAKAVSSTGNIDESVKTIQDLINFENKIGKPKYTKEVKPILDNLIKNLREKGIKEYQGGKWALAKNTLAKVYDLSKNDTSFLQYAGGAALKDKDYDLAAKYFQKLIDLDYKGIATNYTAVNVETKNRENLGNKINMDAMVKLGKYTDPKVETVGPVTGSLYNNLANAYLGKKELDKAKEIVVKGRSYDKGNINLILTQASIEYELGNKSEFANLMKEVLELRPNDPSLYFNIGVVSADQGKIEEAIKSYKKAIELKPDYSDAWLNLAYAEIAGDEKFVKELDANSNNFDKYDEIQAKRMDMFRKALVTFEKAQTYNKNRVDILKTMMTMYEHLEMYDKVKEMKAKIDAIQTE